MRALIVCNGFPPPDELLRSEAKKADLLIGADGGGNIILDHGITPDVVIGDLDSFKETKVTGYELIRDPDQETNDLEKALNYALEKGTQVCAILGAFGQRMDHSLKNLSVLKQFNQRFQKIYFIDEYQEVFLLKEPLAMELPLGTVISLFPLSGDVQGITTTGLKYPLTNESLENGSRDGTSNENIAEHIEIRHRSGDLLVFIER